MNSGGLMPAMKTDTETDVRQIEEILRRIEAAENAGDATAMIDLLAEDAVIMAPDQPVQEGKAACAAFLTDVIASLFEQFDRRIAYVSAEVRVIGEYAFDRGSFAFSIAPRSGGDTSRETGKYLFLYSRAADGSWKIARAIVNLDAHESEEA
ncbi:MAG: hypothetical protein DMG00_21560 [Acidobacteria bacterium]|nr:MAG: hypothetical protein DMG00_21560 [Acidobacteriota bacterium]